ncbi:MAG: IS110 family transposase [Candidatus Competibacteraceae bacterium]
MNKVSGRDGFFLNGFTIMMYLGIDVSKAKLHACLLHEQDKGKTKVVENNPSGIALLLAWAARHRAPAAQLHAVMEATGIYHEIAAYTLFEAGATVSIVNPAQAKDFARGLAVRTKTDGVDSHVLARFGALLKPPAWQPPDPAVRDLQALLARREAVAQDLRREQNRREKALATATPVRVQQSLDDVIAFLQKELAQLQQDIDQHIDRHPGLKADLALLTRIPAVGPQVGCHLLAILQSHAFVSAEPLAAYVGLVPVERQSGTSLVGRARLSKAGPARVRAVLSMAAVVAIRYNPHVKALYERPLARGKAKKAALGAAMRKLVHLCFGVIKTRKPYQADYALSA